jgi:hypothetical protein
MGMREREKERHSGYEGGCGCLGCLVSPVCVCVYGAAQEFHDMLSTDPARAFYGPGHVFAAAELGEAPLHR